MYFYQTNKDIILCKYFWAREQFPHYPPPPSSQLRNISVTCQRNVLRSCCGWKSLEFCTGTNYCRMYVCEKQWPTVNAQDTQAKYSSGFKTDKQYDIWYIFYLLIACNPGCLLESGGHGHYFFSATRRISGRRHNRVLCKVKIVYTFPFSGFFYRRLMMWMKNSNLLQHLLVNRGRPKVIFENNAI